VIKRISFVRRRDDVDRDEFRRYWLEEHSRLGRQLPGIRGYRINFVETWEDDGSEPERWDAFVEIWFDSEADLDQALAGAATELVEDRAKIFVEVRSARVQENVLI
jgi:uncharacterized protein (TIGR02118 family)